MIERKTIKPFTHFRNVKEVCLLQLNQGNVNALRYSEQRAYEQYVTGMMQAGGNQPHLFYNYLTLQKPKVTSPWGEIVRGLEGLRL